MSGVLVVTGASSGIGLATVELAVAAGHRVLALDLVPLEERADEGAVRWEQCDVTDAAGAEAALARGLEWFGDAPSALVHCAGVYLQSPAEDLDEQLWSRVLAVNASGTYHLAALVGRRMLDIGVGSIVLLSSIAHSLGDGIEPGAAYAASKGAIVSLGRQLAAEWGPRGIRTNVVAPGVIDTPMTTIVNDADGFRHVVDAIPLRRLGTAAEIVHVCLFLASDAASYVNGTVIPVDGGQLIN